MSTERASAPTGEERVQDRRDFMRLDKSGQGLLRLRGEAHPVGSGKIVDISANGLNLCCEANWVDRIQPGTPVEVVARLDDSSEPFYLVGDVIWARDLDTDRCQIGIELPLSDNGGDSAHNDNRDWRALFLA